ncbi:VLRF1 family aeRF1-type release factor [Aquibacillus albus]|uniref:DUF1835 domain-containing protein n=1 Tax=Aquibacillus albus TaxID=1168171 RepID=A0ABS2MYM9_9BACI|nr:VLRF1 family aeRF1-type release factor [Aquibacillus albus]MBM7570999.1 hypothetical protein [Aquibacillus albus]
MSLEAELKWLQKVELDKPDSVLSMYLNTDPADPDQRGREWKIQLKNGLNSFENYLEESGDKDELHNFKIVRNKVEKFIDEQQLNFKKSVVIFASSNGEIWLAKHLQMRVKTEFFWQESPVTDQLYQLRELFPKLGVILVQQSRVKVIEAELGDIIETRRYQLNQETGDWQQLPDVFEVVSTTNGNGRKDNEKRWYKSIAPVLDKLAKKHNWEKIYLMGEPEDVQYMNDCMHKKVDKVEKQNILDQPETTVIDKIIA